MKRRSKGSGASAKARRPNTAKLKHRSVPKQASRAAIQELSRELKEALRRETATSDVLAIVIKSAYHVPASSLKRAAQRKRDPL